MDIDVERLRASTRKLLALAQHERVPLTIFGYDGKLSRNSQTFIADRYSFK
jgi:hypothetical protein